MPAAQKTGDVIMATADPKISQPVTLGSFPLGWIYLTSL